MGVDPIADDVMARKPRPRSQRIIDAAMGLGVLEAGVVMAVLTLLTLDLFLPGGLIEPVDAWLGAGPHSLELARTAAFTVLVLTQLFNCFNARSASASAFRAAFSNRWLWAAVALVGGAARGRRAPALPQPRLRHRAALRRPMVRVRGDGQRGYYGSAKGESCCADSGRPLPDRGHDGAMRCAPAHRRGACVTCTISLVRRGGFIYLDRELKCASTFDITNPYQTGNPNAHSNDPQALCQDHTFCRSCATGSVFAEGRAASGAGGDRACRHCGSIDRYGVGACHNGDGIAHGAKERCAGDGPWLCGRRHPGRHGEIQELRSG